MHASVSLLVTRLICLSHFFNFINLRNTRILIWIVFPCRWIDHRNFLWRKIWNYEKFWMNERPFLQNKYSYLGSVHYLCRSREGGVKGFTNFSKIKFVFQENIDLNISWPSNFFGKYFKAPTPLPLILISYLRFTCSSISG